MPNHFAKNLITKGFLNSSVITKGFILPFPIPDMVFRRGSSPIFAPNPYPPVAVPNKSLEKEKKKDYIVVYINWNKYVNKLGINIYTELLKQKIEAELINTEVNEIKIISEPLSDFRKTIKDEITITSNQLKNKKDKI